MNNFIKSLVLAVAAVLPSSWASASQVILGAVQDNTIYRENTSFSNGAADNFTAGNAGSTSAVRRGLIAFDLSSLPAGIRIDRVALELTFQGTTNMENDPRVVAVHRLLSSWGEGTSNAGAGGTSGSGNGVAATTGDATWRYRFFNTQEWATFNSSVSGSGGGDFAATASATATVGIVPDVQVTWETLRGGAPTGLVADVEQWLADPASNSGWLLKMADESPIRTARRFYSKETTTGAFQPRLVIDYTAIPEPASLVTILLGTTGLGFTRRGRSRLAR
jgi:hypothetical protein